MARKIHSRYKITGDLVAKSPIHIGGLGGNTDTDLALAINGKGEYYIPGTSLAGALRSWMEIIDPKVTNDLWGYQKNEKDQEEKNGSKFDEHASFILVEDAVIDDLEITPEIRDGVSIDRNWGTAVDKLKFDRMILPRGVKIPLEITLERPCEKKVKKTIHKPSDKKWDNLSDEEWNEYQAKFAQLLSALKIGQISIGAAKTRGLGRVILENLSVKEQVLHNSKGILNILKNVDSEVDWTNLLVQNKLNILGKLEIEIQWKPTSPVMVKASGDGIAVDILPLISGFDGGITFVLPGSSIKGAFRTQAERILRTVLQIETPRIDNNSNKNFNDQINLELIKTLFGSPSKFVKPDNDETNDKEKTKEQQLGYLGALSVDDCFAKIPLKNWSQVENAINDKSLRDALNHNNLNHTQQAFHVAIDRWTGGAADNFLYTVLEPIGVNWQSINLSIDLNRLNRKKPKEETDKYLPSFVLFLLTLRDLMNQRIPLGFGTNRGMGAIEVTQINFKSFGELNDLQQLADIQLNHANLSNINPDLLKELETSWQTWIKENKLVKV